MPGGATSWPGAMRDLRTAGRVLLVTPPARLSPGCAKVTFAGQLTGLTGRHARRGVRGSPDPVQHACQPGAELAERQDLRHCHHSAHTIAYTQQ
jgi:hypothetical protein